MNALTVPLIVELCPLDSRLGRSLSANDPISVHARPTASEITIKTLVVSPDISHFHASADGDRLKNPIQTPYTASGSVQ